MFDAYAFPIAVVLMTFALVTMIAPIANVVREAIREVRKARRPT